MSKLIDISDLKVLTAGQYAQCQVAAVAMNDADLAEKIGDVEGFLVRCTWQSMLNPVYAAAAEELTAYRAEQALREMIAWQMRRAA